MSQNVTELPYPTTVRIAGRIESGDVGRRPPDAAALGLSGCYSNLIEQLGVLSGH